MKKLILLFLLGLTSFFYSFAQPSNGVEMADGLRSSGKIYVVVSVVCVIFLGFIAYLFVLDRKISRLENKEKNK
ncbi:CcmD family protein [Olivibacter sp. SDN3]|uniref:CcmD family protein n=1 Tax=Olivibacter sp. SDN3 TaxID=2764720 RepID=UPI001C9E623E|nr:CcmD family protein [Olivibacter sp. SDN3]